jgi:hypothetical protein
MIKKWNFNKAAAAVAANAEYQNTRIAKRIKSKKKAAPIVAGDEVLDLSDLRDALTFGKGVR